MTLYDDNLDLFSRTFPKFFSDLQLSTSRPWEWVKDLGEPNLSREEEGRRVYLLDPSDPKEEAKKVWLELLTSFTHIFFVYGVGLGNVYDLAKIWLDADSRNHIIFLEDDPEVLRRFLETEIARALVNEERANLIYLSKDYEIELFKVLNGLLKISLRGDRFSVASLPSYQMRKKEKYEALKNRIYNFHDCIIRDLEFVALDNSVDRNYLVNILQRHFSYDILPLKGRFSQVPAIVCGAGASIEDDLCLIKEMKDRALLLAGGSAVNVLSSHHIQPHFVLGIDPNLIHFSKILQQTAFEAPFVYVERLYREALSMIQGPKLYMKTYRKDKFPSIVSWIDDCLKMKESISDTGYSVTTLAVALAHYLGCNPIILDGVDMSYARKRPYAIGMMDHPVIQQLSAYPMRPQQTYLSGGAQNQELTTTYQFNVESRWMSNFQTKNPGVELINASSMGLQVKGIKHQPLVDILSNHPIRQDDMHARAVIEALKHPFPQETSTEIKEGLQKMKESFARSLLLLAKIAEALDHLNVSNSEQESTLLEKNIVVWMEMLREEVAYKYNMIRYDHALETIGQDWMAYWAVRGVEERKRRKFLEKEIGRIGFLKMWAERMMALFEEPFNESCDALSAVGKIVSIPHLPFTGREEIEKSSEGAILAKRGYVGDLLDGAVAFFGKNGEILSYSTYVQGKKQGNAYLFYPEGALYGHEHYLDDEFEGVQRYYYPNGAEKSILPYDQGKLHGEVLLFHRNGQRKREIHFLQGLREGAEKWWTEQGILIADIEYRDNVPIGRARLWYPDGKLRLEVSYSAPGVVESKHEY